MGCMTTNLPKTAMLLKMISFRSLSISIEIPQVYCFLLQPVLKLFSPKMNSNRPENHSNILLPSMLRENNKMLSLNLSLQKKCWLKVPMNPSNLSIKSFEKMIPTTLLTLARFSVNLFLFRAGRYRQNGTSLVHGH